MSHFLDSLHPDDTPPHTQGEWIPTDLDLDEPEEGERDEDH